MAWTILSKETCPSCGQPVWICRSSNNKLTFRVDTDMCYATESLEKWQKSAAGKRSKKGEIPYVVPEMQEELPLPSRKEYYNSLAED